MFEVWDTDSPRSSFTVENSFSYPGYSQFFIELERAILKFIWNNKKPRIAKTILNSKRIGGGISILDLKKYYRAIVLPHCMLLVQ